MMYPFPEQVLPILVLLIQLLSSDFSQAVPGATLRPYDGYRTHQEQADVYARGRTKPGPIITNARPGQSKHNQGKAVDVVIVCDGRDRWDVKVDCDGDGKDDYAELGGLGEKLGLVWGGRWKFVDIGHFELPSTER